jgi:hypothetical protein
VLTQFDRHENVVWFNPHEVTVSTSSTKISHDRLLELVLYDPETGTVMARMARPKGGVRVGDRLGTATKDGLVITLDGKSYPLHNIAWFYVHGEWPEKQLNKLDGDAANIAIANLALPGATKRGELTQERLKSLISYDRETGVSLWKIRPAKNVTIGSVAGHVEKSNGHLYCTVDGVDYTVQRLAWLYEYGVLPDRPLRFRDGNRSNVAIGNLFESISEFATRAEQDKHWRQRNPEKVRRMSLQNNFGITIEAYHGLMDAQGGVCAICKNPETQMRGEKVKWLAVDHCHSQNLVRGLLCCDCNIAIGKMKDDPARLRAAADYVERANALSADDPTTIKLMPCLPRVTRKKEAA